MTDYEKMYFSLAGAVAEAIQILTDAQQKGEEAYINSDDAPVRILTFFKGADEDEGK